MLSEIRAALPERLTLHRFSQGGDAKALAEDARDGLTAQPKTLPPKYFYDELGSKLFEA
ncbi:L-histidine N(alpha)-methyltransferase, partial [Salmonella sp. SAL4431]|uniref:L-histidine N(alpha)-methyltransferase n=1 Tax=Salmonella sp. SAL4431 TaxID=3159886 RepID=UPI003978401E